MENYIHNFHKEVQDILDDVTRKFELIMKRIPPRDYTALDLQISTNHPNTLHKIEDFPLNDFDQLRMLEDMVQMDFKLKIEKLLVKYKLVIKPTDANVDPETQYIKRKNQTMLDGLELQIEKFKKSKEG